MDKNEFFREITLRLCGSLEIEKGLHDCLEILAAVMPADYLYIERYVPASNTMHILARADMEKGERLNTLVPLPKSLEKSFEPMRKLWQAGKLPPVLVINDTRQEPVSDFLLNTFEIPPGSALSLPLVIENRVAGTLALIAEGADRFEDEHIEYYSMLKEPFFVAMTNALQYQQTVDLKNQLAESNRFLTNELRRISGDNIIGLHFGLKETMEKVRNVARIDSPVLILGETGTGKDVIANAIHYSSSRQEGPFVKVNCGAIPDSLIDSELFGHEKGAFTGALNRRAGFFERAHKGTIFLDEVGELPPPAQVRLLRVLQDKTIERVGGDQPLQLDIRVIAATNRDMESMVENGEFRQDLWYRLNVFPIRIPPLRDRTMDIPELLRHFILTKSKEFKLPAIPEPALGSLDSLIQYHWPGNVRELANIVERALILNPKGPLEFDLPQANNGGVGIAAEPRASETDNLDALVKHQIERVLVKTEGRINGSGGAAELLGLNPSTLRNRMIKLGIEYKSAPSGQ